MRPYPVLETLYRHNLWANLSLMEVCKSLSEEQLERSAVGGCGTIIDTLRHIADSEESYIYRIKTGDPLVRPSNAQPKSLAQMEDSFRNSGAGLIDWAAKVGATDRVELTWITAEKVHVPKAIILTQAINHATEHRAQIMMILTQLGIEPPDLSSWHYFETQGFD